MSLLTFNKTWSIGIQSIDDQHAVLFEVLNELHAAMLKGQANAVIGRLLLDLRLYPKSFCNRRVDARQGEVPCAG